MGPTYGSLNNSILYFATCFPVNAPMILIRIEPRSALPKLCIWTPSTNEVTKTRILALRTRRKRPSVSIVIGRVRIMRIGRTKVLRIIRNNATTTAGIHPETVIPGTTYETIRNAAAVIARRIKKCI